MASCAHVPLRQRTASRTCISRQDSLGLVRLSAAAVSTSGLRHRGPRTPLRREQPRPGTAECGIKRTQYRTPRHTHRQPIRGRLVEGAVRGTTRRIHQTTGHPWLFWTSVVSALTARSGLAHAHLRDKRLQYRTILATPQVSRCPDAMRVARAWRHWRSARMAATRPRSAKTMADTLLSTNDKKEALSRVYACACRRRCWLRHVCTAIRP